VEYVEHLSDFFRRMLELREKPLVTLDEELDLTRNYLYLQQKRFGPNFSFAQDVKVDGQDFFLPPLTLQILMENAFKHNAVSRSTPLRIELRTDGDALVVNNNVNPKPVREPSTGIGLANVKSRIAMYTPEPMRWEQNDGTFTVRVPLIQQPNA
jgi:sensor histidine kinase YesM